MSATLDLTGLDKRLQQVRTVVNINAAPLMLRWMIVMEEDNRKGILQGLDGFGVPMVPVKYRPKTSHPIRLNKPFKKEKTKQENLGFFGQAFYKAKREHEDRERDRRNAYYKWANVEAKKMRRGQRSSVKAGKFEGGVGNNLTSSQYRLLGGPPLAPRDQFSRVITNFKTTYTDPRQGGKEWAVIGAWDDVVNKDGIHFLPFHFNGTGRLPRRDLRGIRPAGVAKAMDALRNWVRLAIREHFT
jgi:hypothetical protein